MSQGAVLPFTFLTSGGEGEYLGVGMADSLITRLSNVGQLVVRPTTSVLKYADVGQDVSRAGRELQVDFVVTGSVRRAGGRVRVGVQLVSTGGESALWADQFDEEFTDMFAVEDSVSERVSAALRLRLSPGEKKSLSRRRTQNAEAHRLYLKGRYFWSRRTLADATEAARCFRRAVELDPQFALAHAGLADADIILSIQAAVLGGPAPDDVYPEAKRAALRALELDDLLPEAHTSLAHVSLFCDWDWPGAEREFRRAVELNPHYATAHHWYAVSLAFMGRFDEALAEIGRAQELDPLSLIINANVGYVLYHARRYDEAVSHLRETVRLEPSFIPARYRLGMAYEEAGMYDEAVAELQEAARLSGGAPPALAALGHAHALAGSRAKALRRLRQLEAMSKRHYVPPTSFAEVYAALGETGKALDWLGRAYEKRDPALVRLKVNPKWDALRHEESFREIVNLVGLY
jgi:TolB-like protein